jgi:hypothetical protein
VYDPAGAHWYLHYFSLLFVGGALLAGGLAYLRYRTRAMRLHISLPTPVVAEEAA